MEQDQSKVLLVEGAGDEGVIKEILDAWNVPCPCIKACGSDSQVFQALKLYLSNPWNVNWIEGRFLLLPWMDKTVLCPISFLFFMYTGLSHLSKISHMTIMWS